MARTAHTAADRPKTASRKPGQCRHALTGTSAKGGPAFSSPQLSPAPRQPLCVLTAASLPRQCKRHPVALRQRQRVRRLPCRPAPPRWPALPMQTPGSCAAAQEVPAGARPLGWSGIGSTTPSGVWFSHSTYSGNPLFSGSVLRRQSRFTERISVQFALCQPRFVGPYRNNCARRATHFQ